MALTRYLNPPPQSVFAWALIGATLLPLASLALIIAGQTALVPFTAALFGLSSAHVAATAALYGDPSMRQMCLAQPLKMIATPLVIIVAGMIVFSQPGLSFTAALLLLSLVQAWHFGAQNIGVATFISISESGQALTKIERWAIKFGVLVGALGILQATAPGFSVPTEYVWLPPALGSLFSFPYRIGTLLSLPVLIIAAWLSTRALLQGRPKFSLTFFLSVTFLLPIYASPANGFLALSIAHGLQYLIFLGAHAGHDAKAQRSRFLRPALLLGAIFLGVSIWTAAPAISPPEVPALGIAVILSLSLAHFWIDRFVWRMRDPAQRQWIKSEFAAVLA